MQQQLLNHIALHSLCKTTDKILLAVSGGIDSMVMLDLFRKAGFMIGVAHCNFQLRGAEADQDEALVSEVCERSGIPVFTVRFNTSRYANEHNLSTQMAARKLRYDFFEQMALEKKYDVIATAHNLNDVFETVLLNLTKGTGFEGITGIPLRTDKIVRPLLFADRKIIEAYARGHEIVWREDASNISDDYQRNFIRNKIVPSLREINPNLENTFQHTLERLRASSAITRKYLEDFRAANSTISNEEIHIAIAAIAGETFPSVILWELIKDHGFNFSQCTDIVNDSSPGRRFISSDFELIVDREVYIIHRRKDSKTTEVLIEGTHHTVSNGCDHLLINIEEPEVEIAGDESIARLDSEKLSFPLRWRKWKNGDTFRPLGMTGSKKVSDFLVDRKVPLHEKDDVTIVESAGEIIWVVGFRISEVYKVTAETKQVLTIRRERTASKKNS